MIDKSAEDFRVEAARITKRQRVSAMCTCGAGSVFPTLRAANAWEEQHLVEGSEGCDHAVNYQEVK